MTTAAIACYDYGDKTKIVLAADKRLSWHNGKVTKLWKLSHQDCPFVMAVGAGTYNSIVQISRWLTEGMSEAAKPEIEEKDFHVLAVDHAGQIWLMDCGLVGYLLEEQVFAIGSGSAYAMGAMAWGATPERAVEIAARYDMYTGDGVDILEYIIEKEED